MKTVPGIHVETGLPDSSPSFPRGVTTEGRHEVSLGFGDWLHVRCDSRHPRDRTFAQHLSGAWLLLEGYLTGISGLSTLDGSGVADVLRLYLDEGIGMLLRLRGSYTGLIADPRTGQAHLFNDRRASRPLFICDDGHGRFCAGPEFAVLARQAPAAASFDPVAACEFVLFASYYNDRTLFTGIRRLRPGTVITLAPDGRYVSRSYWRLNIDSNRSAPPEDECIDHALEHMERSCRAHRVAADNPVLLLSGGGDSRAILASLRKNGQVVAATSYSTDEGDDVLIARRLAAICGLPFTAYNILTDSLQAGFVDAVLRSDGQAETIDTPGLGSLYDTLAAAHDGFIHGDRAFCSPPPMARNDALTVAGPIGFARARRFADMLEPGILATATASTAQTLADMRAAGANLDPVDLRDKIYFEQRIANRQNGFAAMKLRQLEQIRPWLDEDFIEFQFRLPAHLRVQRRIVRGMVAHAAPDLAAVPYAAKDSIPHSQTFRRLIPRQLALAEFIRHQFTELLDPRIADIFRAKALENLAVALVTGASYPIPNQLWWRRLPGSWRWIARRYEADLIHPVRILLRVMQLNIFLRAVEGKCIS